MPSGLVEGLIYQGGKRGDCGTEKLITCPRTHSYGVRGLELSPEAQPCYLRSDVRSWLARQFQMLGVGSVTGQGACMHVGAG